MAQSIELWGATYSNVPAVLLPKSPSGTARFTDVSDTTAIAANVSEGTYFYTSDGVRTAGTATGGVTQDQNGYIVLPSDGFGGGSGGGGGGESGSMSDPIRFFDYDGTLVASYTSVPESLPSVPTHSKLTNGTWNYTLAQIATQFNAMGTCDVGANYDTASGKTEIDIILKPERLHPYLSLAVNGTVEIDWGDNSTSTSTGTSLTKRKSDIHHEYAAAGSYTIKISKTSGTGYSLYCTSAYCLLNKNVSTPVNANRAYSNCVQSVRVGDDCTIGYCAFYGCTSLTSVSIPSGVTSIGSDLFSYCYSLTFVAIPSGVTSINSQAFYSSNIAFVSLPSSVTSISGNVFYNCYSLTSVSIPSGVTSIGNYMFQSCYSLASLSIPPNVTSIGSNMFYNCYSLASVTIPSGVTSINSQAFNNCLGMAEYHIKPTTPPTLTNTNAFTNIQSDCKIYVPSASLATYQAAENWSTYASYMVGE